MPEFPPSPRPNMPEWASYLFDTYSLRGLSYPAPYTLLRRRTGPDGNPDIYTHTRLVAGTGIPVSTLKKFKSGEWTPTRRTLDKLRRFYERHTYARLRSHGVSRPNAKRLSRAKNPRARQKVKRAIRSYRKNIKMVAAAKDIPEQAVQWAFSQSPMKANNWDQYIRLKSYKPPSISRSRPTITISSTGRTVYQLSLSEARRLIPSIQASGWGAVANMIREAVSVASQISGPSVVRIHKGVLRSLLPSLKARRRKTPLLRSFITSLEYTVL